MTKNLKKLSHDAFIKKCFSQTEAAKELLTDYLPAKITALLDLSTISVEKESYVEDNLKQKMSDLVYSIKTKDDNECFVYTLLEHQSTNDHWIAMRLLKYSLLLLERHSKKTTKLPLVIPLVIYNGKTKYTAPRAFADLFHDPLLAQEFMLNQYSLIDLHNIKDDQLSTNRDINLVLSVMKHIYAKNIPAKVAALLNKFLNNKNNNPGLYHIYIMSILWYIVVRVNPQNQKDFEQIIKKEIPNQKGDEFMRSLADVWMEEGIEKGRNEGIQAGMEKGIQAGIEKGIQAGMEKGIQAGIEKGRNEGIQAGVTITAIKMLKKNLDNNFISSITGLSNDQINHLKNKL